MKYKRDISLLLLAVLLVATSVAVYGWDSSVEPRTKPPLKTAIQEIEGYSHQRDLVLIEQHIDMLKLDDHIFADYLGPDGPVNLYIGYYHTPGKAYAAHSPTVCYPSQGWIVETQPLTKKMTVGSEKIHYQEIITSYGEQKELVLYWYQARLKTSTSAWKNKIDMGLNRLSQSDSHHSFVRIAVPFNYRTYKETTEAAFTFIDSFYPHFSKYLISEAQTPKTI